MMRARTSRAIFFVFLIGGAVVALALPPRQLLLASLPTGPGRVIRGAFHIHTDRSDGTGTLDQVSEAAARAGLKFIVVTDHGDTTRLAQPSYKSGVLCIDATEISTDGGHVIALGLPRAAYPLAGEARDVLEDIKRLGGTSIVAHPTSGRPELRWVDDTTPYDGVEWLNGDSEWRDEPAPALARVLLTYWFRGPESLARLLDRPEASLALWDNLTQRRPVVGLAGGDVHARIGVRGSGEPYDSVVALRSPGYEQVFRTFSISLLELDLTGDAEGDARSVMDALRRGHVYSSVDALAAPAQFRFTAVSGENQAQGGDSLEIVGPVTLRVEANAPAGARIILLKDGKPVESTVGAALEHTATVARAVYRVEVEIPRAPGQRPIPWIVSNPIYVGRTVDETQSPPSRRPATEFAAKYDNGSTSEWEVERTDRASGAIDVVAAVGGKQLSMRYALAGVASENPYVAFVAPAGPTLSAYNRLVFTGRSSRPMRISVQLRAPNSGGGERWYRSVYLDETPREVTVFFDDLSPKEPTGPKPLDLADVRSVLFVVDTVNTALGSNGQFWVDDVKYGR